MKTGEEKAAFKQALKKWATELIGQRIATAKSAMEQAQEAANSEEKSSAGDKYETGRAMGHLQRDMHARQLAESIKELATLQAVQTESIYHEGRTGALLQADNIAFYIIAGLGKQVVYGETMLFLSPQAPLAKTMIGKKAGDTVFFNQSMITVRDVF